MEWDEIFEGIEDLQTAVLKHSPGLASQLSFLRQQIWAKAQHAEQMERDLDALINVYESINSYKDRP